MKCKKCGKELTLSGFEGEDRVEIYSCRIEGCQKNTDQIREEDA